MIQNDYQVVVYIVADEAEKHNSILVLQIMAGLVVPLEKIVGLLVLWIKIKSPVLVITLVVLVAPVENQIGEKVPAEAYETHAHFIGHLKPVGKSVLHGPE